MLRNAIFLLVVILIPATSLAAECVQGADARRCYLGVPAVDTITKEAEAMRPPRHRRNRYDGPKCQGQGGPGCLLRVE